LNEDERKTENSYGNNSAKSSISEEEEGNNNNDDLRDIMNAVLLIDAANEDEQDKVDCLGFKSVGAAILDQDKEDQGMYYLLLNYQIVFKCQHLPELTLSDDLIAIEDEAGGLIKIVGDIFNITKKLGITNFKEDNSNLKNIVGDILIDVGIDQDKQSDDDDDASNLKSIASDILVDVAVVVEGEEDNNENRGSLIKIVGDIYKITTKQTKIHVQPHPDKLQVISTLTNIFIDLRIEPQLTLAWLLAYTTALNNLNADKYLTTAFVRWAWTALTELNTNSNELGLLAPNDMVMLTNSVCNDLDWFKNDTPKVIMITILLGLMF